MMRTPKECSWQIVSAIFVFLSLYFLTAKARMQWTNHVTLTLSTSEKKEDLQKRVNKNIKCQNKIISRHILDYTACRTGEEWVGTLTRRTNNRCMRTSHFYDEPPLPGLQVKKSTSWLGCQDQLVYWVMTLSQSVFPQRMQITRTTGGKQGT